MKEEDRLAIATIIAKMDRLEDDAFHLQRFVRALRTELFEALDKMQSDEVE